jgi:antitoxin component YwqK of YwqJK toxin-antitoxin module
MKTTIATLLLVFIVFDSYSQEVVTEDEYPRFLMAPLPDRKMQPPNFYDINRPNQYKWENRPSGTNLDRFQLIYTHQENIYPWIYGISNTYFWIAVRQCGDNYYDSGNIQSRCACNEDSIRHGKSVTWDEIGNIIDVSYYYNGILTSTKRYDKGKLTYSSRFKAGKLHGKVIEIWGDGKTISYYQNGNKTGIEKFYQNGHLNRVSQFENSKELAQTMFSKSGDTISSRYFSLGQNGTRIPSSRWTEFNNSDSTTSYVTYINGLANEIHTYEDGYFREHHVRQDNGITAHIFFNSNQDTTTQFFTKPNDYIQKSNLILHGLNDPYQYYTPDTFGQNEHQLFVGKGYFTSDSCIVHYDASQSNREHPYLICHKVIGSDTAEAFYAANDGISFHSVVQSNTFALKDGKYQPHGEWRIFDNNKIVSVANYDFGQKNGAFYYFDTTKNESQLTRTEHYFKGAKDDRWTTYSDSILEYVFYDENKQVRMERYLFDTDTTISAGNHVTILPQQHRKVTISQQPILYLNYINDSLIRLNTFWDNGHKHWSGLLKDGIPDGIWQERNDEGVVILEGHYNNGVPEKKWNQRIEKRNDSSVYRHKKITPELPDLNPSRPRATSNENNYLIP